MKTRINPGTKIGGISCKAYLFAGDIVIVWMHDGSCNVFKKESIDKKAVAYKIEGQNILEVMIPDQHELIIFKTRDKAYFRDFNNRMIEEADTWVDYYFEPLTSSFYRKDLRGNWYDIEGYRLAAPVFLKDNVLCSLEGKVSRRSITFRNQQVVISPAAQLIQLGKLVYDTNLELVNYFGEKITGLGNKYIKFSPRDVLQEVLLGLNRPAFINEFTKEPYLLYNEEVTGHVQTVTKGNHRFEVFKSATRKYIVEHQSDNVFSYDDEPVLLDFNTYIKMGRHELIAAKLKKAQFYMEINYKVAFSLPNIADRIIAIDMDVVKIGQDDLFNIKTMTTALVYNETRATVFTIEGGTIRPEAIKTVSHFENHYAYVIIEGVQKLFYKKHQSVVRLGEEHLEIAEISGEQDSKLLNARDIDGREIVLDARKGLDELSLAMSTERTITRAIGMPRELGHYVLQNVRLQTLGGSEPRVINLNEENMPVFTLPEDLREFPERDNLSGFHANPVLSIDFDSLLEIDGHQFLTAEFLSFFGNTHTVVLQENSAKPLHLEGAGHRNELITGFDPSTLSKSYFLGTHRMIGAYTLTEELKASELLFALDIQSSWISFYESYLPILKKVVELRGEKDWEYLLFELREISGSNEYIAVEKNEPYRVLVEKKKGKPVPKIVKSKEKVLKTPEEISIIKKIFLKDPGFLMEVD